MRKEGCICFEVLAYNCQLGYPNYNNRLNVFSQLDACEFEHVVCVELWVAAAERM